MQIDIILEPDLTPAQVAEIAVVAEKYGFRTLWHSNFHQNPDAFMALMPAAQVTSRIKLGVLAVSPYEMHPIKIGNALLTLNEASNGRGVVAIGGGGAVLSAMANIDRQNLRMVKSVREATEIVKLVVSGEPSRGYEGEIYKVAIPINHQPWKTAPTAKVFTASTREQMLEMAGRVADGTQLSDVTPEVIHERIAAVHRGIARRETPIDDFRIGNFWAWHIKEDVEQAKYEARRELVFRGQLFPPKVDVLPYVSVEERQLIADNMRSFNMAYWTRSGVIEGVPAETVDKLIAAFSSTGGLDAIDAQIERFRIFERKGLTELSIRLFDEPMAGLKLVGDHVLPKFETY